MAKLGDRFPVKLKNRSIDSQLVPGQVIKLEIEFERTKSTKNKFLVLTLIDNISFLFCINSGIVEYIQDRKHLRNCQIEIKNTNYNFLRHNSYINCSEIIKIEYDIIKNQLSKDVSRIKDKLINGDISQIIKIVNKAVTLSEIEKELIIKSLRDHLENQLLFFYFICKSY